MIAEVLFIFWRLTEIVFLIPIIGMLAYFVNGFLNANQLTPAYILVLFIVSTIAVFWCIDTVLRFGSTRRSAFFVSFIDLCFFGALIAGVYELRFIAGANCTSWTDITSSVSLGPFGSIVYTGERPNFNKTCSMLKASFAIGIMEVVFFFFTAFLALMIFNHHRDPVVKETVVRRRSHSSRRGHRHSRSGSSSRRHYVV
ncbi:conserved hypothetical protein [Talaromyces stipitatus ATCC 10500]|uniref:MARVEL domain-containing protein n=1 Tax=Talaromyces stipitatus (strain ATCC 10500 / CBS 375.48 / QM 6759 / NRRL 1006) TaxID=441959 RepID=B8ME63_TALSN|nr:uncharacterized protein TSTA_015750 [Talaromyces stipitatus ATCC 10500]EED16490.1 conserved hypothetical protein [Talaromyces stipitatus ATCC 10500]